MTSARFPYPAAVGLEPGDILRELVSWWMWRKAREVMMQATGAKNWGSQTEKESEMRLQSITK
jgi:hypothetical protein